MQWTPDAMQELERYLKDVKAAASALEADAQEVSDDLRSHLEESLRRRGSELVTADDVRAEAGKLGMPGGPRGGIEARRVGRALSEVAKDGWALALGALLPVFFALQGDRMDSDLYRPLFLQSVLFWTIPPFLAAAWIAHRRRDPHVLRWALPLAAAGLGTSLFQVLTMALNALQAFTIDQVSSPWEHLIAFGALASAFYLWNALADSAGRRAWAVLLAAFLLNVLPETPGTLTRVGMRLAESDTSRLHAGGLAWLRRFADRDAVGLLCEGLPPRPSDLVGNLLDLRRPSVENAAKIHYQAFGRGPTESAAPRLRDDRAQWGGEKVGYRVEGLSLRASHVDAKVFPDALVSYLEWTLEFENTTHGVQEARAHVALPPDGVVSRLTLWVDGKEREAVFHETGKVRRAYQSIVRWRRDPVLVTSAGKDRVMVQCFPVPANGRMKVRLGITAPMASVQPALARLHGPAFIERNFAVGTDFRHTAWYSVKPDAQSQLPDALLTWGKSWAEFQRDPGSRSLLARDPVHPGRTVIQKISWEPASAAKVAVVLDTSLPMADARQDVKKTLEALPQDVPVYVVGDREFRLSSLSDLMKGWDGLRWEGGKDNAPALQSALHQRTLGAFDRVLWLHGPQAVELSPADPLAATLSRGGAKIMLVSRQFVPGPHKLLEAFDGLGAVRTERPDAALEGAVLSRELSAQAAPATEAGGHVARLWARDRVVSAAAWRPDAVSPAPPAKDSDDPLKMAMAYRLVTPISGAVVLETDQQYKQTGLVQGKFYEHLTRSGGSPRISAKSSPVPGAADVQRSKADPGALGMSLPAPGAANLNRANESIASSSLFGNARMDERNLLSSRLVNIDMVEQVSRRRMAEPWRANRPRVMEQATKSLVKDSPAWIALLLGMILFLLEARRLAKDEGGKRTAFGIVAYALLYPFLPAAATLILGGCLLGWAIATRRPLAGVSPWTLSLLALSLPAAPPVLEGLGKAAALVLTGGQMGPKGPLGAWMAATLYAFLGAFLSPGVRKVLAVTLAIGLFLVFRPY